MAGPHRVYLTKPEDSMTRVKTLQVRPLASLQQQACSALSSALPEHRIPNRRAGTRRL